MTDVQPQKTGVMKKMWREAGGAGFTGSFADFADAFNKLAKAEPVDKTTESTDTKPWTEKERPELKILGMSPVAFGATGIATLVVLAIGVRLIFFRGSKKSDQS